MAHIKKINLFFLILFFGFLILYLPEKAYSLTNISACGVTLNTENEYYLLNASINASNTCITIGANNVTLDGAGYTINYSQNAVGYAINNTLGYNFTTIKNLNLLQGNAVDNSAYAIKAVGMNNGNITNNSITTTGTASIGIYFTSAANSNAVVNNSITTSGGDGVAIYINSSTANNILNNTITTTGNTHSYGIYFLSFSNHNTIANNTIHTTGSYGYGIYLLNSSFDTLSGNAINTTRGYAVAINPTLNMSEYNHTIDTTNTEQGRPIYYYFANTSVIVQDIYDAGQILIANSTNFTLKNITIIGKDGVYLLSTINSSVLNSNITTGTQEGVNVLGLYYSNLSTISNNIFNTSGVANDIYLSHSYSNSISYNNATASANGAVAAYLDESNSNTLLNNNFTSIGGNILYPSAVIYIRASNGNNITGGWTNTKASPYSYDYRLDNAITNNFTNTDFTSAKKIRFSDSVSYFNYNDQTNGNVWMKTNTSGSGVTLNRVLKNWNSILIRWNETPSTATTANYTLTGLLASTDYIIYNTSGGVRTRAYMLSTNSAGDLPPFTIDLNSNTDIKVFSTRVNIGQDLDEADTTYTLIANVSSAGTCFTIKANNVTLDGAGYTINYSQSEAGYAINNTGYNFTTIKNTNILQNTTQTGSYAIYFSGASNGTIQNNTITTSGPNGHGIYLWSSSNSKSLADNVITTTNTNAYGVYIRSSSNNSISTGSIISTSSFDYVLDAASTNNNFTNTNFTAKRWIYFNDETSWFNYNNETNGNIWLKTRQSSAPGGSLNRTLTIWSNSTMKWNETPSTTLTATYNLTGLLPSKVYVVYNTTGSTRTKAYTKVTDANGATSFDISLTANTQIQVQALNLSACGDLDLPEAYNLVANVSSEGTCFSINADNLTLDGAGYTINYSQSATGYGVNIAIRNNITLKNMNIVQSNSSISNAHGIYASAMTNSNLTNNNITSVCSSCYGLALVTSSDSNKLLNNRFMSYQSPGIYIQTSNNNNITDGLIDSTTYRDYFLVNVGDNNRFTNTGFTNAKSIYFTSFADWFNYNNETNGNIWLKTNVSAAATLTRTLITWSDTTMKWNDTNSTGGITARYNLTGLLPSTTYVIYNTTTTARTKVYTNITDASGVLPSFTIALNGNTQIQVRALNLTACGDLDLPETYNLVANVSSAGTCFTIKANNVALDGQEYTINYSKTATGYGINNSLGYDNITIKNLNIVQSNASVGNIAYGIYGFGMDFSNITNNNITTASPYAYPVYLYMSSNNAFLNNVLESRSTSSEIDAAFGMRFGSNNTFIGGSLISPKNNYYLENIGSNNTFINNNFTAARKIYFYMSGGGDSHFLYNNETNGNIWLNTNVSATNTLTRTLVNWNTIVMRWNDTNGTAGLTARYNLTGMLPSTTYYVYNTSAGAQENPYTLTTDASGNIPSFTIALNGNTEIAVGTPTMVAFGASNANWNWALPYTGDKIRLGNELYWQWTAFNNSGAGWTIPGGAATNWTWAQK